MKFYGIDSVNPIQLGTPSNDDALTNLLAWDPNDGKVKYRGVNSISGGGSGSQTLSEVLQTGNNTGTYSLKFLDNNSEIYPIIGGTFFSGWTSSMSSVIAITSSAFVFNPTIEEVAPGINVLRSTIGAIVYHPESNSGLSKSAWMCGQNGNGSIKNCLNINPTSVNICSKGVVSCSGLQIDSSGYYFNSVCGDKNVYMNISGQSPLISFSSMDTLTHSTCLQMSENSLGLCAYSFTLSNGNCFILGSNTVDINGVCGSDGQVISINTTGQLCWQTPITGSGGGGSTILNLNEIGFGTGTGITSSSVFTFNNTYKSFIVSDSSSIDSTSCNSVIVGGCCNTLQCGSNYSSIVGGFCNTINCGSCYSSIVGGSCNTLQCYSSRSSMVGGFCNILQCTSYQSSIVGGCCNTLQCGSSRSSIVGGFCNTLFCSFLSSIVGGYRNTLCCNTESSSIIGGNNNTLSCQSYRSSIIGGVCNTLSCYSNNSLISASRGSQITCSCNSVVLGGECFSGTPTFGKSGGNQIIGGNNNLVTGGYYSYTYLGYPSYSNIICNLPNRIYNSKSSTILGGGGNIVGTSSNNSSIVAGHCNTLECNSCNSAIIGGSNLSLCNECNIVYVPELKFATASNDDALTKVLVWDEGSTNKMKWRDVNTIGASSVILPANEVGFGDGTGITSSTIFTFNSTYRNLNVSESSLIDSTSCNSVIVGGSCNTIATQSCFSSVIGGNCNRLQGTSSNSSIVGGYFNTLQCSSINSSIVGGCCNTLQCNSSFASIVGGRSNTLQSVSNYSSILGGSFNTIQSYSNRSSIVGGSCNTLQCGSVYSSIFGGQCNTLQCNSCYSSIVAGHCNTLECNSCNSAIIGGSNLSLCNECNIVYVPELKFATASNDDALTKVLVWDEGSTNKMKWRDVNTIGASSFILPANEVGFGDGTGITSSTIFTFNSTYRNLNVSESSLIDSTSCNSVIVGGFCNTLNYLSTNSSIVGGYCNTLNYSSRSSIVGGVCNTIATQSYNSTIVGGLRNTLQCNSQFSSIIGGDCNTLQCYSKYSSMIGGQCNILQCNSQFSSIIGGSGNTMSYNSCNSSIIGGYRNCLNLSGQSVILGGSNLCLNSEPNLVYVPELKVATASNDNLLNKVFVFDDASSLKMKWRELSVINLNPQSSSYTLLAGDEGKVIEMTNAGDETLTVPDDASLLFSTGTQIVVLRSGAGNVTITPGSGVTLSSVNGYLKLNFQFSAATLLKSATDTWYVFGDLKS